MNVPFDFAGLRLLVLEDEMLLAMAMEDWMESFGCEANVEARVADALRRATQEPLDGALLDVNVAGERSWPVAEALAGRDIPFIFMTGYVSEMLRSDFRDRPILRKPFTLDDLKQAMTATFLAAPSQEAPE